MVRRGSSSRLWSLLEGILIVLLATTLWLFLDQVSQRSGMRGVFDRQALEATVGVVGALLLWLALAPRRIRRRRQEAQQARKEARAGAPPAPGSG